MVYHNVNYVDFIIKRLWGNFYKWPISYGYLLENIVIVFWNLRFFK